MQPPVIEQHSGIFVVRDDLFPGGTKARFIPALFVDCDELVYASPACGGAQYALATVAKQLNKRATIFLAKRKEQHPRSQMAAAAGARLEEVSPGYLAVVQKRAAEYAKTAEVKLCPFGLDFPEASTAIAEVAAILPIQPDQVWCASGSGVLARGLMQAWPAADFNLVQVGRELTKAEVGGATIWPFPIPFEKEAKDLPGYRAPFSSDRNYDLKAWQMCLEHSNPRAKVLFWNVLGEAKG